MTEIDVRKHKTNINKTKSKGLFVLSIALILLVTISFAIFTSLQYMQVNRIMSDSLIDRSAETIRQTSLLIEKSAVKIEESLRMISKSEDIQKLLDGGDNEATQNIFKVFKDYKDTYPEIENIYIGTEDKKMYLHPQVELPDGYDPTSRPWYKNSLKNEGFTWSEPYEDAVTGRSIITLSVPVYNSSEFIGVLSTDIHLDLMIEEIKNIPFGMRGYITITDQNGQVVFHPNEELIGRPIPIDDLREAITKGDTGSITYGYEGKEKFAVFSKANKLNLNVIGLMEKNELTYSTVPLLNSLIVISIISSIVISFVILLMTRKLKEINDDNSVNCENTYREEQREIEYERNELKDKLDRLKDYRRKDVITEDEYERKREDIINDYEI